MPEHDKAAAIGASNYRLLKSGLATWEDIVTPNRVRDFREVVAKKNLTVKQMVAHGVKPYQAQQAYSAVHTTEHEAAERHRPGTAPETDRRRSQSGEPGQRTVEAAGRTGHRRSRPDGTVYQRPGLVRRSAAGFGGPSAAELAGLIAGWKPTKQRAAMQPQPIERTDLAAAEIQKARDEQRAANAAEAAANPVVILPPVEDEGLRLSRKYLDEQRQELERLTREMNENRALLRYDTR